MPLWLANRGGGVAAVQALLPAGADPNGGRMAEAGAGTGAGITVRTLTPWGGGGLGCRRWCVCFSMRGSGWCPRWYGRKGANGVRPEAAGGGGKTLTGAESNHSGGHHHQSLRRCQTRKDQQVEKQTKKKKGVAAAAVVPSNSSSNANHPLLLSARAAAWAACAMPFPPLPGRWGIGRLAADTIVLAAAARSLYVNGHAQTRQPVGRRPAARGTERW